MNGEVTKVCPYCAEQVKAVAKVCPRCRQWLTVFSLRNPILFVLALCVLGMVVCSLFAIALRKQLNSGIDFAPYRDSISVVDSRMTFGKDDNGPVVYVVTVITNQSNLPWKETEFDARFFDKTGKLIDAQQWRDYSTIWPHGDSAFRIVVRPSHDLSDYQSYKVFVRSARDAHSRL